MVDDLNESLHKFSVNVHGILIESKVEVVSEFFVLSLAISWISEVVLVEGMLKDVFWFYNVDWTSSWLIGITTHIIIQTLISNSHFLLPKSHTFICKSFGGKCDW